MGEIDYELAKKDPKAQKNVKLGEDAMKNTAATDSAGLAISGGGGAPPGAADDFEEVLQKSQNDLTKVRQIINQGGFTGPDKDKYTVSLHHAEWVHSRNLFMKCDNNIKQTSVKYTALVNGKAQNHEILRAHKEWTDTREKCKKSRADLYEKANQYIETDRRVRANKKAEGDIYPVLGSGSGGSGGGGVEGFSAGSVKEGFDFYTESSIIANTDITGSNPTVKKYNVRLPRHKEDADKNTDGQTTLPWNEYYTVCSQQNEGDKVMCENTNSRKSDYITSINGLFDKADRLLNIYYKLHTGSGTQTNAEIEKLLLDSSDIRSILENQKKNIALHKQNALYDYDEYNSLAFYEDLVAFLYYAVFIIFVVMSLREYFSAGGSYDKRNFIILVILGIYPRYILQVVLWILRTLTSITEMLGLKNVRFWNE
jgi:hypothetical protein